MEEKTRTSHEIDIIGTAKLVFKYKKELAIFTITSLVLGIIIAISTPKTYTTSVILAPEMSAGGIGMSENLSDMASTFGINIGGKSSVDAIYPEIYPEVFSSSNFIETLFDIPVASKNNKTFKTYKEHLIKDTKNPFWKYPIILLTKILKNKNNSTKESTTSYKPMLSKEDDELCNGIRSLISCQVNNKTSLITISATDQDPMVSTILADTLQHRLQEYITNYKTKKTRRDIEYYQKLCEKAKASYIKSQQVYAAYCDANEDVVLKSFEAKRDQLENDMQLKYNNYSQLTEQLLNVKAKLQEQKPAFTVIQAATLPYKASSTPRSMIVIFFVFLGCVADIIWILFFKKK